MRILIVKLSSLGDVVHAMPVVHDIRSAHPEVAMDWVVEPAFSPLLERMSGLADVIACPLREWTRNWWTREAFNGVRALRSRLRRHRYDVILDLQGLTKSALVARLADGVRYGLANRTAGASHEWPARWLVDHPIAVETRIHALDRSRVLAGRALGYVPDGPPDFGLRRSHDCAQADAVPTLLLVHGTSRGDKLWPEASWIALGRRALAAGWCIALPQAGATEAARAGRIAAVLGPQATVWPALDLGAVVDRMRGVDGAIGVDSGLSHIAVALDLPHVQIYNHPTAWRTGPQPEHGHRHQRSVEGVPTPDVDTVWAAWRQVAPQRA